MMETDYISMADSGFNGFKIYPLGNTGGSSGLFFAFPSAAGLGEGDVENDRDL